MTTCWLRRSNYKTGLACLVIAVVLAISLSVTSIGIRESYNVGACKMMPAVPTTTAIVKSHKNKRSSTMATYFQSSFTAIIFFKSFLDEGQTREGERKFSIGIDFEKVSKKCGKKLATHPSCFPLPFSCGRLCRSHHPWLYEVPDTCASDVSLSFLCPPAYTYHPHRRQ